MKYYDKKERKQIAFELKQLKKELLGKDPDFRAVLMIAKAIQYRVVVATNPIEALRDRP